MRYIFPDEGYRLAYVYEIDPRVPLVSSGGIQFRVTTDQAGLVAADITDLAEVTYASPATITVRQDSLLPLWLGPDEVASLCLHWVPTGGAGATPGVPRCMPGPTNASQPLRRPQEPSTATSTWWRLDLSTRLTDAQLSAHAADTTGVYGITDTGLLVVTSDARLTDQRTPLDTSAKVASANKDGTAAIPSMRTPGTGAQQAAAGNDDRFSDARSPSAGSVADASVSTTAAIAESKLALASDAAAGVAPAAASAPGPLGGRAD
jgi:hypothetical protein